MFGNDRNCMKTVVDLIELTVQQSNQISKGVVMEQNFIDQITGFVPEYCLNLLFASVLHMKLHT